jgi:hypothetical protein
MDGLHHRIVHAWWMSEWHAAIQHIDRPKSPTLNLHRGERSVGTRRAVGADGDRFCSDRLGGFRARRRSGCSIEERCDRQPESREKKFPAIQRGRTVADFQPCAATAARRDFQVAVSKNVLFHLFNLVSLGLDLSQARQHYSTLRASLLA